MHPQFTTVILQTWQQNEMSEDSVTPVNDDSQFKE